jgi:imidazolonepropionase
VGATIAAIGSRESVLSQLGDVERLDLGGRTVIPGLVDPHTHPVWAGDRVAELELRAAGRSYVEIAAAGGGIASTVRATRSASDEALVGSTLHRLDELLAHGATTIEAKTGYGLSVDHELRQLDILMTVADRHPCQLVITFLGAHALPDEYAGRADAYIDLVVEEMLPLAAARAPGIFVDAFCDDGGFTLQQTARVLEKARDLGLPIKVHSDEFANLGCTAYAASLGAVSADHLVATSEADMAALAEAGTVAVLLPGTTVGLGSAKFAPAREMIARGIPVALGTDYNPGTCPCPNLSLIQALAVRYLRLSPAEALVASTWNAAWAVGQGARAGRLARGGPADLVVLESDDYRQLSYEFGGNPVAAVMVTGRWIRDPGA